MKHPGIYRAEASLGPACWLGRVGVDWRAVLLPLQVLLLSASAVWADIEPRVLVALYQGSYYPVVSVRVGRPAVRIKEGAVRTVREGEYRIVPFGEYDGERIEISEIRLSGEESYGPSLVNLSGQLRSLNALAGLFLVVEVEPYGALVFKRLNDVEANTPLPFDIKFKKGYGELDYYLYLFNDGKEVATNLMRTRPKDARLIRPLTRDQDPLLVHMTPPIYPESLKGQRVRGSAVVRIRVDRYGCVSEPEIQTATHPAFARAAVAAVTSWLFSPAIKNRETVGVLVEIPIPFLAP